MPQLIECPACHKSVSNQANHCPHCGQPLRAALAEDVQTIEQTAKTLKLQVLLSLLLFFAAAVSTMIGVATETRTIAGLSMLGCLVGLGWYVVVKLLIWWRHK